MSVIWIVGRNAEPYERLKWEFVGGFSTEQKAIEATEKENDWIAPTELDKKWPDELIIFPDSYFPRNPNDPKYVGKRGKETG